MGVLLLAVVLVVDWFASNVIIVKGRNNWIRAGLVIPAALVISVAQSLVHLAVGDIKSGHALMMAIGWTGAHAFMIGIFMAITAIRLHLRPAADSDHLP